MGNAKWLAIDADQYKLQMFFAEEAWDRGFDIFIEDEEVVTDFVIHIAQGGMANRTVGVSYTHSIVAGDDELNILLGGSVAVPDNNPLIQALTLEKIEALLLVGDCNGDGVLNAADLACVATKDERDAVLGELNTLPGDLDGNGEVAFADFLQLSANFGNAGNYAEGNVDLEGDIAFPDFLALSANFGKTPPAASSVPEPSAFALTLFSATPSDLTS